MTLYYLSFHLIFLPVTLKNNTESLTNFSKNYIYKKYIYIYRNLKKNFKKILKKIIYKNLKKKFKKKLYIKKQKINNIIIYSRILCDKCIYIY